MKTVRMIALTAMMTLSSLSAFASPFEVEALRRPGGRSCVATFQTCQIRVGGICLKWNSRSARFDRREARWACERIRRQYDVVRNCSVRCN